MRFLSLSQDSREQTQPCLLGEKFEWDYLVNPPPPGQIMPRFTLFRADSAQWRRPHHDQLLVTAIMFDFDGQSFEKKDQLVRAFQETDYEFFCVFTGGGFHIYIPLAEEITGLVWRQCQASYLALSREVEEKTGMQTDPQLGTVKYGRVPGTRNVRRMKTVQLIYHHDGRDRVLYDELLQAIPESAAPLTERPPVVHTPETEVYLQHCNYLQELKDRPLEINYTEFKGMMKMMSEGGLRELAHAVFGGGKYPDDKIEGWFNSSYTGTCSDVALGAEKIRKKCLTCPHYYNGKGKLKYITGPRPTPNHPYYFGYVGDKAKFDHASYLNGFINVVVEKKKKLLFRSVHDFLLYHEGAYQDLRRVGNKSAVESLPMAIRDILTSWTNEFKPESAGLVLPPSYYEKVGVQFWKMHGINFIPSDYFDKGGTTIPFKNGSFEPTTRGLVEHSVDHPFLGSRPKWDYNKKANTERIESWMRFVCPDEDSYELLHTFVGLCFASVRSEQHQEFLYLSGVPDSGKSSLLGIIGELVGESSMGTITADNVGSVFRGDEMNFDIFGKRFVYTEEIALDSRKDVLQWTRFITTVLSGNPIKTRIKHGRDNTYVPVCTIMCVGNNYPTYGSKREGLRRRLRHVCFTRRARDCDVALIAAIRTNKDRGATEGFIKWAMEGLAKGVERMEDTMKFTPPRTQQELGDMEAEEVEVDTPAFKGGGQTADAVHKWLKAALIATPKGASYRGSETDAAKLEAKENISYGRWATPIDAYQAFKKAYKMKNTRGYPYKKFRQDLVAFLAERDRKLVIVDGYTRCQNMILAGQHDT